MTEGDRGQDHPTPQEDDLQFDRAELETAGEVRPGGQVAKGGALACDACGQLIPSSYYQAGGQILCHTCKADRERYMTSRSSLGAVLRAMFLGVPAALLGSGIYYAISALTGYEFGLVAIVIGLLVGGAVRYGAAPRSGWPYQLLAIFLTYTAIVSTYIPYIVEGLQDVAESATEVSASEPAELAPSAATPGSDESASATDALSTTSAALPTSADSPLVEPPLTEPVADPMAAEPLGLVAGLVGIVVLLLIAFAAPFLAGFENIIGLLIIGIALYEAWRINRGRELEIEGPFEVGADGSVIERSPTV